MEVLAAGHGTCIDYLEGGFKAVSRKIFQHSSGLQQTNKKTDREIGSNRHPSEVMLQQQLLWAAPTFIQSNKKTGDIWILTNFRKSNGCIERKPFPLLRISKAIQKLKNFKATTALDLSQGFYSITIDKESQQLCTTVLSWDKYAYKCLPIGIAGAPDILQSIMMELLGDLEHVLV